MMGAPPRRSGKASLERWILKEAGKTGGQTDQQANGRPGPTSTVLYRKEYTSEALAFFNVVATTVGSEVKKKVPFGKGIKWNTDPEPPTLPPPPPPSLPISTPLLPELPPMCDATAVLSLPSLGLSCHHPGPPWIPLVAGYSRGCCV